MKPAIVFESIDISESYRQPFVNGRTYEFTVRGTITYPGNGPDTIFDTAADIKPVVLAATDRGPIRLADADRH